MSAIQAKDRVEYVGPTDGALESGAKGSVIQVGKDAATVDFGPEVGKLAISVSRLRKVG